MMLKSDTCPKFKGPGAPKKNSNNVNFRAHPSKFSEKDPKRNLPRNLPRFRSQKKQTHDLTGTPSSPPPALAFSSKIIGLCPHICDLNDHRTNEIVGLGIPLVRFNSTSHIRVQTGEGELHHCLPSQKSNDIEPMHYSDPSRHNYESDMSVWGMLSSDCIERDLL